MNLNLLTSIDTKYVTIIAIAIVYILMSLVTLTLYYSDKRKAKKNKWRIKEKTLLIFPWLLGSLGGLIGVFGLRHKTKHWYFVLNNIAAFIVHLAVTFVLVYVFIIKI